MRYIVRRVIPPEKLCSAVPVEPVPRVTEQSPKPLSAAKRRGPFLSKTCALHASWPLFVGSFQVQKHSEMHIFLYWLTSATLISCSLGSNTHTRQKLQWCFPILSFVLTHHACARDQNIEQSKACAHVPLAWWRLPTLLLCPSYHSN